MVVLVVALFCFCVFHIDQLLDRGALPLSPGFVIISRTGWKISNTTSLRPGSLLFKIWDVLFSLLLNEMASWFNLGMHWFLPKPNRVIAAGKHPVGGKLMTPILRAPSPYKFCHSNAYVMRVYMKKQMQNDIQLLCSIKHDWIFYLNSRSPLWHLFPHIASLLKLSI